MAERIKEFEAGDAALRPTSVGTEARAGAARRIGATYNAMASATDTLARETDRLGSQTAALGSEQARALNAVGKGIGSGIEVAGDVAVKYMDHQQISKGSKDFAQLTQKATEDWDTTVKNADPNDPTIAKKFQESLEKRLEDFKGSDFYTENGQKWAEAHTNALRQHFMEKTSADMATLAGQAAVVNQRQTVNSLSATVRSDPASLDFSLAALKSSTEGMIATSPNLKGTQVAAARSEILQKGAESIVKSAALGYIEKTGQVPPWAQDPKYSPYINGEELKQFSQAAKYYQRLGASEDKAARAEREHAQKTDFNAKVNELELSTIPKNAGDKPTLPSDYWAKLKDLGTHPGAAMEPGRLKTMVEAGERLTERLNKPEPMGRVSHDTTVGLINRMRATDDTRLTSNEEIVKAYGDGKLNNADFNFLNKEFRDMKTPEGEALSRDRSMFFKQYAGAIAGRTYDPVTGSPKLYAAEMDARRQEEDLRRKGLDPHLAYDPRSEYFFGKPSNISKYAGSMQEDLSTRATAPAPKREDAMPAIPPPDQRPAGLYETPKGKLKWTGTGWVQP